MYAAHTGPKRPIGPAGIAGRGHANNKVCLLCFPFARLLCSFFYFYSNGNDVIIIFVTVVLLYLFIFVGNLYTRKITLYGYCVESNLMIIISFHFLYPLNCWSGRRGAGAYPSGHRVRGGVHPEQVACPSQGHTETNETNNLTHA